jgi:hypothetical protein
MNIFLKLLNKSSLIVNSKVITYIWLEINFQILSNFNQVILCQSSGYWWLTYNL